jgi:hypothetical protein
VATYRFNNVEITADRQGADRFAKVSYPRRYGRFAAVICQNQEYEPPADLSVSDSTTVRAFSQRLIGDSQISAADIGIFCTP